jgi:hypothetical protein
MNDKLTTAAGVIMVISLLAILLFQVVDCLVLSVF